MIKRNQVNETNYLNTALRIFILLLIFLLLSACNSSSEKEMNSVAEQGDKVEEATDSDMDESDKNNDIADDSEDTASESEDHGALEGCDGVLLSTSQEIAGEDLKNCFVEAMVMQQTGTHIVKNSSGITTNITFQWNPSFSMVTDNGEFGVILNENTGWMETQDGRWVQENANSDHPEVILANTIVQGYRTFADPRFIGEILGMVSTWTVVEEDIVPDSEAFTDKAWKLTTDEEIDMNISLLSELEFWMTNDYLGAYFAGTATMEGVSDRTSNTFSQWGGEVDIPDPE